jgi:hypothetical protein
VSQKTQNAVILSVATNPSSIPVGSVVGNVSSAEKGTASTGAVTTGQVAAPAADTKGGAGILIGLNGALNVSGVSELDPETDFLVIIARAGVVIMGGILVVVGLITLTKSFNSPDEENSPVQNAISTGKKTAEKVGELTA